MEPMIRVAGPVLASRFLPGQVAPPFGAGMVRLFRAWSRTPLFDDLAKFRCQLLHDLRVNCLKIDRLLRVIVQVVELDSREALLLGFGFGGGTPAT